MELDQPYSETGSAHMGIGCLVAPIALIGTVMILDYPGPPGPIGFAEFFGWWAVCLGVAIASARLSDRWRKSDPKRHGLLIWALSLPIGLTALAIWDITPSTPGVVKDAVEYGLQAVGLVALFIGAVRLCRMGWKHLRR